MIDRESLRDLELLAALEQDSQITQRRLATKLGIALGLTNIYVKRLARKGYIKCVTIPSNRLKYLVTPRGLARKAQLTYEFMQHSLNVYRDVRRHLRRVLAASIAQERRHVAIYGTGEAAELAYLSLRELGLEPVAVFDGRATEPFLGLPVRSIREHAQIPFDLLIVASLADSSRIVAKLLREQVPADKIVTLRPNANGSHDARA